jgi:F-type H+-transporting ATPase subunit epsilon
MIHFELVTLNGVKHSSEVHEVILPTIDGQIAVFAGHAPLVSVAKTGMIAVRVRPVDPDDFLEYYAITGGVIEIMDDRVRVLVDEATKDEEVAEEEARTALAAAKELYREARDKMSLDKAQALIDREAVRLKVAELRRRRRK